MSETKEPYNLGEAQKEAKKLSQKINSGEAPNYTEAEKQLDKEKYRENLSEAKRSLESLLESLPNMSIDGFRNTHYYLRKANEPILAEKIYGVIPKASVIISQQAIDRLNKDVISDEGIKGGIRGCLLMLLHDVRKFDEIPKKEIVSNEVFYRAITRFIADTSLAEGSHFGIYNFGIDLYRELGDVDRVKEAERLLSEEEKPFNETKEVADALRKAYADFMAAISGCKELDVNLEEVLLEVKQAIDNKLLVLQDAERVNHSKDTESSK